MDDFQEIKKRSLGGIGSLLIRQVLTKLIFLSANIALARLLAPQIFGVYAIVSFIVQFFSLFGEVGLGAALIQKKSQLEQCELSSIFWFQQAVAWCMALILILAAPLLVTFYPSLPSVGVWLVRAMAVSLVVSSLKSVPVLQLERNLDFTRIAYIDIAESISFHAVAVGLAYTGWGVWSFVIAAICRSLASVAVVFSCSRWRPGFEFDFASVRQLLRFGIPYQGNNILAFVKDAVTPIFVGIYAGASAVGFVNWAKSFAFAPLMLSEVFGRVAFPAFSRIQSDHQLLARTIEKSIRMMTLVLFPLTALMVALGPQLIQVLYTDKWMPGIHTFYFYCTSPAGIGIFLPLYSGILALGKSNQLLFLIIGLIVVEWGLGVPFVMVFGFVGVAMTQPVTVPICSWLYWLILKRLGVHVKILRNVRWQLLAAITAGGGVKILAVFMPVSVALLMILVLTGLCFYLLILKLFHKIILDEFKVYFSNIISVGN